MFNHNPLIEISSLALSEVRAGINVKPFAKQASYSEKESKHPVFQDGFN